MYSQEMKEKIRQASNIVQVVSRYVSLTKKGKKYWGLCPFHTEKSPSFTVDEEMQLCHCFGCKAGGDVFYFLEKMENLTFPEAMERLANEAGIEMPKQKLSEEAQKRADERTALFQIQKEAAIYYAGMRVMEQGKFGKEYFDRRGLSEETQIKFGLGVAPSSVNRLYQYLKGKNFNDKTIKDSALFYFDEKNGFRDIFWNRVIFPIMDINNKVIAFGGRIMTDSKNSGPKYLNSSETSIFEKKKHLYGLNYARRSKRDYFLLCEGYMDVISLHQAGFDNAVASLGTAFTEQQAALIARYKKKVCITYDSDGAGVSAALRAIPILKGAGISVKVVSMQPHKDPDEFIKALGAKEYEKRIADAELSFFFGVEQERKKYNLSDPEQKTNFFTELAIRLLSFSQELERENYVKAACERYQISESGLKQLMHKNAKKAELIEEAAHVRETNNKSKNVATPEEAVKHSQELLLTMLCQDNSLFEKLKGYLGVSDFLEEPYASVAGYMYEQYEQTKKVNPAEIVSRFENLEAHQRVCAIFQAKATVQIDEELSSDKQEAVINECIKRIKKYQIDMELNKTKDGSELLSLLQKKKALEKLYIRL